MASCTLCKVDHGSKSCNKMKGCGKCAEKASHKASGCPLAYPKYDHQVCDKCLEPGHEAEDCAEIGFGLQCKLCGHWDHTPLQAKKNGCPLLLGNDGKAMELKNLGKDVIDKFTPKYREKALVEIEKLKGGASSSTPSRSIGAATGMPTRAAASGSPSQTPSKSAGNGKQSQGSSPNRNLAREQVPLTAEEEGLAQLARWKLAERKMPKKQVAVNDSNDPKIAKTNFFEIKIDNRIKLFKYSIAIEEVKPMRAHVSEDPKMDEKDDYKRKVQRETKRFLINDYLTRYNIPDHDNWACDYDSTLVSVGPLYRDSAKNGVMMPQPASNTIPKKPEGPQRRERSTLSTTIDQLGPVDMNALSQHVAGKKEMETPDDLLKLLNIITWKNITKPGSRVGKVGNKVYPEVKPDPGQRARQSSEPYYLRHGFFTSMRPGENSVLLNVNTVTTAFLSPINLHAWMKYAFGNNFDTFNSRIFSKMFAAKLKGVRVTLNLHDLSRTWIICECKNASVSNTTFPDKAGKMVSVATYLKDKYKNGSRSYRPTSEDLNSPCINLGTPSNPVWYPANVLTIVDWQIAKESVQKAGGEKMVDAATRKPNVNVQEIMRTGLKVLGIEPLLDHWKTFGLTPSNRMFKVNTKVLQGPAVLYAVDEPKKGQKSNTAKITVNKGAWNLADQKSFMEPKGGNHMIVLPLVTITQKLMKDMINGLSAMMSRYKMSPNQQGLQISYCPFPAQPIVEPQGLNDKKEFRKNCQSALDKMTSNLSLGSGDVPFFLIILENRSIPIYQEVKRWADCRKGLPSVCITLNKLRKSETDDKIRANLCLKINFKMKGVSHWINGNPMKSPSKGPTGAGNRTMIVGADVTHPGKSSGCPSMAAIVATNDETSGHYLGSARLQPGKQEYIADLEGMMAERVLAWHEKTTADKSTTQDRKFKDQAWKLDLPDRILFYRDGVSESQYGMVLHEEKDQIMRGCAAALETLRLNPANRIPKAGKTGTWIPKLTLVVVTKRHHARFYPLLEPAIGGADPNLPPGTVVETGVVTPWNWTFYLQSHHSELGTARSALYVVVYDDCKYSSDELQRITNNICWTSARATNIVSVCTPARYADLLCDRLRCYMKPALDGLHTPPKLPNDPKSPNSKSPNSKPPTPNSKSSGLSKSGASSSGTAGDQDDGPRSVEEYAADEFVWSSKQRDGRKNPWHSNLDGSMFYL